MTWLPELSCVLYVNDDVAASAYLYLMYVNDDVATSAYLCGVGYGEREQGHREVEQVDDGQTDKGCVGVQDIVWR